MKNKLKKIFITGGAGFIGSHVSEAFFKNFTKSKIIILDKLTYAGNKSFISSILKSKRVRFIKSDINDTKKYTNFLNNCDLAINIAAESHVDNSIEGPEIFLRSNVLGTFNMLEVSREHFERLSNERKKVFRFHHVSTDEVFGPAPDGIKYQENDRYNSTNPYSATKAGGEELAVAYENTYQLPVYITHTMNVFGERQHPEKFIPMCIRKIRDNEKVTIHSDKTRTTPGSRHYIHADDVASAVLFLLNYDGKFNPTWGNAKCPKFNIVGAEELDNLKLAEIIAKAQDKKLNYELVDFHSSRPGHDLRYALDGNKMRELGWAPDTTVVERLRDVTTWTLQNDRWL